MNVRIAKVRIAPASENKTTTNGKRIAAAIVFAEEIGGTAVVQVTEGQLRELVLPFGVNASPDGFQAFGVMMNATAGAGNHATVETHEHKKDDEYTDKDGNTKKYEKDWTEVRVQAIVPSAALGNELLKAATKKITDSWSSWTSDFGGLGGTL